MKFVVKKREVASDKDLLMDLESIIKRLNSHTITIKEYDQIGSHSSSTIIRRFGSWNAALKLIGISPSNTFHTNVELLDNIRDAWLIKDEGLTSPAYSQFELFANGYAPYYDYLLRYMDDIKAMLHLSKNLRSSLTETDFGAIPTCVPPSPSNKPLPIIWTRSVQILMR